MFKLYQYSIFIKLCQVYLIYLFNFSQNLGILYDLLDYFRSLVDRFIESAILSK